MFPTELTFIDIETTAIAGPDAGTDAIIEVAAARVNLKTRAIDAWSTLVHDGRGRAPQIGAFHGDRYARACWSTGLSIEQTLDTLGRCFLTKGATIAGQNPGFDLRCLRRDWEEIDEHYATKHANHERRLGPWPQLDYHQVDLVSPAFLLAMTGAIPGCSMRHTLPIARRGVTQTHRAMQDVLDAIAVFWMLADAMAFAWGSGHFERNRDVR